MSDGIKNIMHGSRRAYVYKCLIGVFTMNSDERGRLKRSSMALHSPIMQFVTEYRSAAESMTAGEEEKLDRLPETIRESVKLSFLMGLTELLTPLRIW